MQSFGCQMWDAAFAIQAIISSDLAHEYGPTLRKAHDFVKASQVESLYQTSLNGLIYVVAALWYDYINFQVRQNPTGNFTEMYRHTCKGAWTFSTQDHGWQVSDCTGEGLKVILFCKILFKYMCINKYNLVLSLSPTGCPLVLTNVTRPSWGENGKGAFLWCCECYSFPTSKD